MTGIRSWLLGGILLIILLLSGLSVRIWAQSPGSEDLQRLINDLKDDSWQIRWYAVTAMGDLKDPGAVEPLIKALKDPNSYVRATSAWALGEINERRAITPLIEALGDESHGVRKNAAQALKALTGRDLGQDQDAWLKWWNENK